MYRGTEPGHFWPKLAGWLIVPSAAALATRLVSPMLIKDSDSPEKKMEMAAAIGGVAHALGAAASWYASEHAESVGTEAFFRGGMWSEMVSAVLFPAAVVASGMAEKAAAGQPGAVNTAIKGLDPSNHLNGIINMLTGGVMAQTQSQPFMLSGRR